MYLEENAAATEIRLTEDEVAELEAAVPQEEIVGERYAAANLKAIDR
jgi:aryl-alcohol dehydrogenase-like predicted oxidoreductase